MDTFLVDAAKVSGDDAPAADLIRALVNDDTVMKGVCMIFYTDRTPDNNSAHTADQSLAATEHSATEKHDAQHCYQDPVTCPAESRDTIRDGKTALLYIYNDGCYKLRFSENKTPAATVGEENDTAAQRATVVRGGEGSILKNSTVTIGLPVADGHRVFTLH